MAETDTKFTSDDTFANPAEKTLANTATATDANGVERIVAPVADAWTPAPTEASQAEIEAAERRNRMFDKASKDRQALLSADAVPEGDKQVNDPSQGGSQSVTQTKDQAEAKQAAADKAAADQGTADNSTTTKETKK